MKAQWFIAVAAVALLAACSQPEEEPPAQPEAETAATEIPVEAAPAAEPETETETAQAEPAGDALDAVLADARRDDDRIRDEFRNPGETLRFFEVEPNHTVVEALPGGGWYSRILVPYTQEEGRYLAINYPMAVYEQIFGDRLNDDLRARLEGWEESFPIQTAEWGGFANGAFRFGAVPEEFAGQADRVLYIRALHNMARTGNLEVAVNDAFTLLKPGGMVGVVQHRAPADETDERADGNRGYLRQADVIDAFEAAGFELVAASDINANPFDTADYDVGVWALPPSNRGDADEEDIPPLQSIGESDRMTLKFRKPE
jgi:predicted methyltransferase